MSFDTCGSSSREYAEVTVDFVLRAVFVGDHSAVEMRGDNECARKDFARRVANGRM